MISSIHLARVICFGFVLSRVIPDASATDPDFADADFAASSSVASNSRDPDSAKTSSADVVVVRVLSSFDVSAIELHARASDLQIVFDGVHSSPYTVKQGDLVLIRVQGARLLFVHGSHEQSAGEILVTSAAGDPLTVRIPGRVERLYAGEIELRADYKNGTLAILNRVDLEQYVSSVVASEYGLHDTEGAKAMAVVARTYALRSQLIRSSDFDLLDDSRAQVYRGIESITEQSRRAALDTSGETLLFDGALIQAVYSSSNGGKAAANESVWAGNPISYLRGQDDPYDAISPHSNWRVDIDRNDLHSVLTDRYGLHVASLRFSKADRHGRIRNVTLYSDDGDKKTITGAAFRSHASTRSRQLKSTFFTVTERGDRYEFAGHGFGHGVGLSQWGAHGMALKGSSYGDILDFYYPGTTLSGPFLAENRTIINRVGESVDPGRLILGWGGGWTDLHAAAVSGREEEGPTKQPSEGVKRRKRVGW